MSEQGRALTNPAGGGASFLAVCATLWTVESRPATESTVPATLLGTVAAAMEGRFLGLPTLAVSLCTSDSSGHHFATAARVARMLVGQLLEHPLERAMILNVNVPDLPFEQLRGLTTTRLGMRHPAEAVVEDHERFARG